MSKCICVPDRSSCAYCSPDGTAGWEILPGTDTVIDLAGGELEFARGYVRGFRVTTWLVDRDPAFRITSPSPNVVRISDGDISQQLDITLDSSSLPVKVASTTLSDPAHPMASEEITTEWETVQGIRFPKKWTVMRAGVRVAEALYAHVTLNSSLKVADLAAKPRDLKPVLSSR